MTTEKQTQYQAAYGETYRHAKQVFEQSWIKTTMHECKYNQSKAAKRLDMSRGCLRMKLAKYFGNEYFRDSDNE